MADDPQAATWTFLSNHGHVLVCLAVNSNARLRDIAVQVGITERAVQRIVSDLEEAGIITRIREGRRNHYSINLETPMRHPLEDDKTVGDLLEALLTKDELAALSVDAPNRSTA